MNSDLQEFAMRESARMRLLAGEYEQMGFAELARYLRKEADAALRWCGQ